MRTLDLLLATLTIIMSTLAQTVQRQRSPKVLVFTKTVGFRHDSIPTAIEVLKSRAGDAGVEFSFTE